MVYVATYTHTLNIALSNSLHCIAVTNIINKIMIYACRLNWKCHYKVSHKTK